jgi:gamma-glutamylcyclotransferase (GGCT)/AIG2-like uncharacterized protein YtfP
MATFGRLLDGKPDTLPGFASTILKIEDPVVIATSGTNYHPIVQETGNPDDTVDGTVFEITEEDLAAADAYEVSDYMRIPVRLGSGLEAWVYVEKD